MAVLKTIPSPVSVGLTHVNSASYSPLLAYVRYVTNCDYCLDALLRYHNHASSPLGA